MVKTPIEKEAFVKQNLGLVHSCANRLRGRGIEYDDLFGAGCVGLIKAIDGFDESRGLMFSTYAVPVILGEIRRLFRDGGAVKVSRGLKETALKTVRAREIFSHKVGREPTVSELSEILSLDIETVIEALNVSQPTISLSADDEEGGGQFDLPTPSGEDKICDTISLNSIISGFEEKDRRLIIFRYFKNKTQVETAELLGMTQVQVSRREKKLLQRLKSEMK